MKTKEEILRTWLEIDMYTVAHDAGFTLKTRRPDYSLVAETIRFLDYETSSNSNPDINAIIGIIALMWERTDKSIFGLKDHIVIFLSRIGYPSSAIICDDNFNNLTGQFSELGSYIYDISSALNRTKNEVSVAEKRFVLTNFQKEVWDALDKERIVGISAPTSAGKSFVLLWKIIDKIITRKIDVVYVVPTLSLINQVTTDFRKSLDSIGYKQYQITNSYEEKDSTEDRYIYVLTQEKAIAALTEEKAFADELILVVDEVQNIERVDEAEDVRAKTLFDTMIEFRQKKNVKQIILSGPRIEKLKSVGKEIFGKKTNEHSTEISPVLGITYSIKKIGKKYYFKQYTSLMTEHLNCEIEKSDQIKGYGKKKYDNEYMTFFNVFLRATGGSQNIVFSPTSKNAREMACMLKGEPVEDISDLIEYYAESIHPNYTLCKTLENGVCYHHGKLPAHVRRTLEKAISDKKVSNIVCTTTLLQGVNLPAQNVYIRNPHLYITKHKGSSELTDYEMANLRGRAGRLLKDFVGRTFVMDEVGFLDTEGYQQEELFDDVKKELPTGYEKAFEENRLDIEEALSDHKTVDAEMNHYGYLVTYIRQNILRYGNNAQKKMKDVGITLSKEQVAAIKMKLDVISVPREICLKNRYWDPLVLDVIFKRFNGTVPNTIVDKGIKNKIDEMMKFLRDTPETKEMYNRYVNEKFREGRGRGIFVSNVIKWTRGISLKDILSKGKYDGEKGQDEIEDMIKVLENDIAYSFPLLLKPLFDMKNPVSNMLSSMQAGASDILTRRMIEKGVPRETAILLMDKYFTTAEKMILDSDVVERKLREAIKNHYEEYPYWVKIQLEFLV